MVSESSRDDKDEEALCGKKRKAFAIIDFDDYKEGDLQPQSDNHLYDRADKDDDYRWADREAFIAEVKEDYIPPIGFEFSSGGESTTEEEGDLDEHSNGCEFLSERRFFQSERCQPPSCVHMQLPRGARPPRHELPQFLKRLQTSFNREPRGPVVAEEGPWP